MTRPSSSRTRQLWAEAFTGVAREYWTEDRIRARLGSKQLILHPVRAAPLLRALGLLHRDASLPPDAHRKYMQINHMVRLLRPFLLHLADERGEVRLLDAGCGSSYLTLLLAWCFRHVWRREAWIMGVDRDADIITRCRERAELIGLQEMLLFEAVVIGELDADQLGINALVSLHACDTATDDALALGVRLGVDLLAAAPCCQVELSRAWTDLTPSGAGEALIPLYRAGHLRREAAATVTDLMRTLLLRARGYQVTAMEFVPSQHTPKNTLLRAVRQEAPDPAAWEEYCQLVRATGGAGIKLEELLPQKG